MKIFLSALEASPEFYFIDAKLKKYKYNLLSFYKMKQDVYEKILNKCELMLIDSGAHSFQKGAKANWEEYTRKYANWIKRNDNKKILGFFEMDIDNIVGYDNVLKLRKILESVSNKIIPVWHKNRGIGEFKKMCETNQNKIIAITGFRNEDIKDEQYLIFLKYAKKYNCKVHCLGMTRKKILETVPFDFVDSSSWKQSAIFGRVAGKKVSKEFSKKHRNVVMLESYRQALEAVKKYEDKWV